MSQKQVVVRPGGTMNSPYKDTALNDSDKTVTVPTGKIWMVTRIAATIATTAVVGNRLLAATVSDGTNVYWTSESTGNIAASQYGLLDYDSNRGARSTQATRRYDDAGFAFNVVIADNLPELWLKAGHVIRIRDLAAVDAAADDMIVFVHYIEYEA